MIEVLENGESGRPEPIQYLLQSLSKSEKLLLVNKKSSAIKTVTENTLGLLVYLGEHSGVEKNFSK
jgi:hypothetical protein